MNALEQGHVEETDREKPQNYVKIQLLKGVVFNILVFCGWFNEKGSDFSRKITDYQSIT